MKKAIIILIALLFTSWTAQAATDYGFKIGGVSVTSDNCNNVTGSYIKGGTVVYNPSTKTVTLTDVTIERTGSDNRAIYNNGCSGLIVELVGNCKLSATDAAPVRFERKTFVEATAGSSTTITGGNEGGIYVTNSSEVTFMGEGYIKISASAKGGIEGSNNENIVTFTDHVRLSIYGRGGDLLDIYNVTFAENCHVWLEPTNISSSPNVKNVTLWKMYNRQYILEPFGISFSESAKSVVNAGVNVYREAILISSNYVALLNSTTVPDATFRNFLIEMFPKKYITEDAAAKVFDMNLASKGIASLTGIEYFPNLITLDCSFNSLQQLSVTKNTFLTTLKCNNNKLTELNISKNTSLSTLYCNNNQISKLDFSNNSKIKKIHCYMNKISGANADALISSLPQSDTQRMLYFAKIYDSNEYNRLLIPQADAAKAKKWNTQYLTGANTWKDYIGELKIDATAFPDAAFRNWVSANIDNGNGYIAAQEFEIENINVSKMGISSLKGIEYFANLRTLNCSENNLSTIDLSKNKILTELQCHQNQIQGDGAQAFADNLPQRSTEGLLRFKVKDVDDANILTPAQVATITGKLWKVQWLESGNWIDYLGEGEALLGDVNRDGKVNVGDVTTLVNMILGVEATDVTRADINGDTKVDVTDVTALVNIILGHS